MMTPEQIRENGGYYYIAPASEPANRYAAGDIEENRFATPQEAEGAAEALRSTHGGDWIARFCDHVS